MYCIAQNKHTLMQALTQDYLTCIILKT